MLAGALRPNSAWAEDRARLRSNPSAVPGAKTDGAAGRRSVLHTPHRDWHQSDKPSWQDAAIASAGRLSTLANTNPPSFQFPVKQDCIADFHAAGRHTHITELFRNGASVPEAKELARHSDIRQTMKYTHIGIEDQARAVGALPALHWRCSSGVSDGHSVSLPGASEAHKKSQNPCQGKGFDTDRRQLSPTDKVEAAGIEPASRDLSTKASTCVASALHSPSGRSPADYRSD